MAITKDTHEEYRKLVTALSQQRDELRVQMYLASMEARDEWNDMETKWNHMKAKGKQVGNVVDDTSEDIHELLLELGEEIKKGYERIKEIL